MSKNETKKEIARLKREIDESISRSQEIQNQIDRLAAETKEELLRMPQNEENQWNSFIRSVDDDHVRMVASAKNFHEMCELLTSGGWTIVEAVKPETEGGNYSMLVKVPGPSKGTQGAQ